MYHIVLFEPEIPPNTGNIMRLCANTGFKLHLIEPLGFSLEEKQLKRAGMDYIAQITLKTYPNFEDFLEQNHPNRLFCCSSKADRLYADVLYRQGDYFVFGPESRGLPQDLLKQFPVSDHIQIPMASPGRSLNLSNAVAIITYEAWRQNQFCV
jgi:tRNA (cytidine/uridine-2'-O-)-methyltransferase